MPLLVTWVDGDPTHQNKQKIKIKAQEYTAPCLFNKSSWTIAPASSSLTKEHIFIFLEHLTFFCDTDAAGQSLLLDQHPQDKPTLFPRLQFLPPKSQAHSLGTCCFLPWFLDLSSPKSLFVWLLLTIQFSAPSSLPGPLCLKEPQPGSSCLYFLPSRHSPLPAIILFTCDTGDFLSPPPGSRYTEADSLCHFCSFNVYSESGTP